ncbi:HAD family phosphatase [Stenotrophomonas sp. MMGLT7]|uniref:HAD family hydrolase n=1 Tax=Stenotrophomonas sp. MMGLT7 TaxID=2901227 RepID=UPI001E61180F|nr:HAD family phosphatase [Stenotrophomonas sp. MMGLT7]MCD7097665.1 HAD family phosphatase [Stenotrophomonas sp. MMGLT7]
MPFAAVLFDCDGVLVDSEPITLGVLRDVLEQRGWKMSQAECDAHFLGRQVSDEAELIAERTGQPFTRQWLQDFWRRRDEALSLHLQPIPGAEAAVDTLYRAYHGRIACASGSDRGKLDLQLRKTGLYRYFEGRIYSGYEVPHGKPAPDVYLAAAAGLGVDPRRCAVVEDTPTGASAGLAAGATVFGYCPGGPGHGSAAQLREAGVHHLFHDMERLPALLEAAATA